MNRLEYQRDWKRRWRQAKAGYKPQPSYPPLVLPTKPEELAYIAGLFDGEGCVSAGNLGVAATIHNTNKGIMADLQCLGGAVRLSTHRIGRPCYEWRVCGERAREFLSAMVPYLRIKKKQTELALELLDLRGPRGIPRSPETQTVRLGLIHEIRSQKRSA